MEELKTTVMKNAATRTLLIGLDYFVLVTAIAVGSFVSFSGCLVEPVQNDELTF